MKLVCKQPDCGWFVYCRKLPTEPTMKLRKFEPTHTCKTDADGKNIMANAKWVAVEIEQDIRNHKLYKLRDIKTKMWEIYGIKLSYWTAWAARIKVYKNIHGNYEEGYKFIPELCRVLQKKNPGSIAIYEISSLDYSFMGLCVAFKASLDGFVNGCRPVIGLYGTFLKGKYGGVCLVAISLDAQMACFQ